MSFRDPKGLFFICMIDDEVPMGNNHRLYLRVLEDGAPTDCVIESDVPAHPYQVMGVGSRRDWRISLTLDEVVAIKS